LDCEPRHTANEPHRTAFHVAASTGHEGMAPLLANRETTMTKFKTSHRNELLVDQIDIEQLDAVVGGAINLSPQLALAANPVGGWTFKDVFAKPTLGTYH